jgi:hypothetical protein
MRARGMAVAPMLFLVIALGVGALYPTSAAASTTRFDSTDSKITYSSGWNDYSYSAYFGGSFRYTNVATSTATIRFRGTALGLVGTRASSNGIMAVSLDGGAPVDVDLYSATWAAQRTLWSASGLAEATHTVSIAWSGRKNAGSSGTEINLDAVDITGSLLNATNSYEAETATDTIAYTGTWGDYDSAYFSNSRHRVLNSVGVVCAEKA